MLERDLYPAEPSLDSEMSKKAIRDIFTREEWMKFSSIHNVRFERWLDRYLNLHAKIPSLLAPTPEPILVPAMFPLETFKTISERGVIYDGGGFSNGALIRIRIKEATVKFLFVDEDIVKLFNYDLVPIERVEVDLNKLSSNKE